MAKVGLHVRACAYLMRTCARCPTLRYMVDGLPRDLNAAECAKCTRCRVLRRDGASFSLRHYGGEREREKNICYYLSINLTPQHWKISFPITKKCLFS